MRSNARRRGRLAGLTLAAVGLLMATTSQASVAPRDFVPSRALAVGASRAMALGNEAIYLNPAGLALDRRYTMQLDYSHVPGEDWGGNGVTVSIADSISNPKLPMGISYRYLSAKSGDVQTKGAITDLALAHPIASWLLVGARMSYLTYVEGGRDFKQFTGDVGLMGLVGPLTLSAVGFNLIQVDSPNAARGVSTGVALGDGHRYRIGADVRWEWANPKAAAVTSYAAGAEYLLANAIPLRVGLDWDEVRQARYWSLGAGFLTAQFGADISYRRDAVSGENMLSFALKLFSQ